jgi:glycosyltransferase involved in cell wall biosynthesis
VTKSVLIDGRLIGYRYGGIATYARQLAIHSQGLASNLSIRLGTRRDSGALSDRSVQLITPPHHRFERLALGAEIHMRGPSLVHSTDYVHPLVRGIRTIATVHDLAFLSNPSLVTAESYDYYAQIIQTLPAVDRVITVSAWTRQQLLDQISIDEDRVSVIPNGHEPRIFNPVPDRDHARLTALHPLLASLLKSERPIVLMVGTIEPRKRHEILLDAFDRCYHELSRVSGTDPFLIVAGQAGWLSDDAVRNVRRLQGMGRALWLRDVTNRELAALYRASELLVMPSIDEGFGIPVLESMACGTPALVSNVPALTELVDDSGFIEETSDAANWSDKIGRIIADREIRGRRAKRSIARASPMTWRETAQQTVAIYRGVLND